LCVNSLMEKYSAYFETVRSHGFENTPILIDEWGMASAGFYNREECPELMARETEVFSAYFVKLIVELIRSGIPMEMLAICLSGQHEMTEDFSGFRNFFTLNFIKKPIYNAHLLTSKMGDMLVKTEKDNENVFAFTTKDDSGRYSTLLTYCSEFFKEDIPNITEELTYEEDISGKKITVWCIDRNNANPYRTWERLGKPEMTDALVRQLRNQGNLNPVAEFIAKGNSVPLNLTPNSMFLVIIE